MSKEQLKEKISNLIHKLDDLFGNEYNIEVAQPPYNPSIHVERSQRSQRSGRTTIHHHHHHHSHTIPWMYWPNSPTYVTNNHYHVSSSQRRKIKKRDEDDEEEKKPDYFTGGVILTGVSFVATFVFSKDGYIKMWRSNLKNDLDEILNLGHECQTFEDVEDAVLKCEEWINQYEKRTKPSFWDKVGLTVAGLALGVGAMFSKNELMMGGTGLGVLSGCHLLWNNLDFTSGHKRKQEGRQLNTAIGLLYTSKGTIERKEYEQLHQPQGQYQNFYNQNVVASAPPLQ